MKFLIPFLLQFVGANAGAAAPASPAPVEDSAPVRAVRAYHAALAAGDAESVVAVVGPTYFMADERSSEGPDRVHAHLFLAGEQLASWPTNYLAQVGPHVNEFETVSESVRRDAAVVITRDTGSNRFRAWKGEETTWLLGRVDEKWRIVGMIIRDIQLPEAPAPIDP